MLTIKQQVVVAWFALLFVYWVVLNFVFQSTDGNLNFLYSLLFSVMPLIGGIVGMSQARDWGGLKSHVGKAIFFISFGLFLWGSGSMVWSYYNFIARIEAPYPSLADVGFAPSIFFYGLGAIYLSIATGAKFGLRNPLAKLFAVITAIFLIFFCYYFLVVIAREGVLVPAGEDAFKASFDITYPLGDFMSLLVAVIVSGLSFPYLGGRLKWDVYSILLGLAVMFIGDFIFSYTTTVGTFYDGDYGDLILTLGLFLLTFGVLGFNSKKID